MFAIGKSSLTGLPHFKLFADKIVKDSSDLCPGYVQTAVPEHLCTSAAMQGIGKLSFFTVQVAGTL